MVVDEGRLGPAICRLGSSRLKVNLAGWPSRVGLVCKV